MKLSIMYHNFDFCDFAFLCMATCNSVCCATHRVAPAVSLSRASRNATRVPLWRTVHSATTTPCFTGRIQRVDCSRLATWRHLWEYPCARQLPSPPPASLSTTVACDSKRQYTPISHHINALETVYCSRERHKIAWAQMQSSMAAENPPWISLVLTLPFPNSGPGRKFITSVFVDRSMDTMDPPRVETDGFDPFENERLTMDRIFSSVIPSLPSGHSIFCAWVHNLIQQNFDVWNIIFRTFCLILFAPFGSSYSLPETPKHIILMSSCKVILYKSYI